MGRELPRICFVAYHARGALAGIDTGHVGGIERQTSLMARWFARRGHDVSMITWDEGQADGAAIDGVRVFKMCRENAGIKGIRFFHPKWTSLCQAMKRANADVYYYNCGDLGLGQVVIWCRRHKRKSVYSVASDPDCDPKLPKLKPLRERVLFRYGLHRVDSIIVQTQRQQQMLREGFGIKSTAIPMPCIGLHTGDCIHPEISFQEPSRVLWVGRISREKRCEWLLDIAGQCPEIAFDIVGAANTDCDYASRLVKRASGIPNVRMHGRIPHNEIVKYYRRCHVLCCTSAYEGFPNTFLEAWSCGIPVVSTIDPDGVIAKYGLGWHASSVDEFVDKLRTVLADPREWRAASEAARSYYLENHTVGAAMAKFERAFLDIAER